MRFWKKKCWYYTCKPRLMIINLHTLLKASGPKTSRMINSEILYPVLTTHTLFSGAYPFRLNKEVLPREWMNTLSA